MPYKVIPARKVKVRAVRGIPGVFTEYQPVIGKIYDGEYRQSNGRYADFCVITVNGKQIVMRDSEFEIVEVLDG